jgi:hypothetical protein
MTTAKVFPSFNNIFGDEGINTSNRIEKKGFSSDNGDIGLPFGLPFDLPLALPEEQQNYRTDSCSLTTCGHQCNICRQPLQQLFLSSQKYVSNSPIAKDRQIQSVSNCSKHPFF